jgi:hypothetical protein
MLDLDTQAGLQLHMPSFSTSAKHLPTPQKQSQLQKFCIFIHPNYIVAA